MTDILTDIQLRLAGALDRFADHGDGGRAAGDLRATALCILSLISERRAAGVTSVDVDEKTWERLLGLSARYGSPAPELVARAIRIFLHPHAELVKRALAVQVAEQEFTAFEDANEWKRRARKQLTALTDAELVKVIWGDRGRRVSSQNHDPVTSKRG